MRVLTGFKLMLSLVCMYTSVQAQEPVFVSGQEGFKSFRIPAIIRTPKGELLSFAEGRVHGSGDFGDIDIVMKKSTNQGKTWSKIKTVVDYDKLQAGNPAPVVDLTDPEYPKGRIFLFYNTGNNHEGEVRHGKGLREVWYKTSVDGGESWSEGVNITTQVHRPNRQSENPAYNFSEDWRSYANTPGHALQFKKGPYKDRIYIPANHSAGNSKPDATDYVAHGFYSDDHGKTFKISENVKILGSNESTAAEISKGGLLMNSRNQNGHEKFRIVSLSSDGGAKWDTVYFDRQLPDPVNEGSILTIQYGKKHNTLAFSNAADANKRDNLTLRISKDDGKTWKKSILIDKSSNHESDFTAYSDLVQLNQKQIGVLYERDNYRTIVFKVIDWTK